MNDATWVYINRIANAIRLAFDIAGPIGDIDHLVKELGGSVVEKPDLDPLYGKTIRKTGDCSFEITVSPYQNHEQRNFAIAHELGHLFLHTGYLIDDDAWDRQSNGRFICFHSDEAERQTNAFAAALLMPEKECQAEMGAYSDGNAVDMAKVADYFHVSITAATNRGRDIGFLR